MKSVLITALMAMAWANATLALASEKLAEEKQCLQCHAVDRHAIGPSFRTIKAIYQKMKNPEASLISVMRHGNDANLGPYWGGARMPDGSERPLISDDEARQLARWILS